MNDVHTRAQKALPTHELSINFSSSLFSFHSFHASSYVHERREERISKENEKKCVVARLLCFAFLTYEWMTLLSDIINYIVIKTDIKIR